MIDAITFETAHLLGDALPSMFRLRHRVFVERQQYQVPTLRLMEWDQFDTPAAVYLVWRDEAGSVRGCARLIPTTFPYMIRDLWPHLVDSGELPTRPDAWEVTRLGIDRDLDADLRLRVQGEMLCALGEFGLAHGIKSFLMVTNLSLIRSMILKSGCVTEILGRPQRLGRFPVVAARIPVVADGLAKLRRYHGVDTPILNVVRGPLACVG